MYPIVLKGVPLRAPNPTQFKVGDVSGGNYTDIETDGTVVNKGDATTFDEISRTFFAEKLDISAGRVDYNFDELTVDFAANARYPQEVSGLVIQAPHAWKLGGLVRPHIHWIQTSNAVPNILIEYRVYNNGDNVPSTWTKKALTSADLAFDYTSGSFQNIINFNLDPSVFATLTISHTFDCKIYRDTANASGLFAGADAYAGVWSAKYYDIHFEKDMNGSREEFVK